MSDKPKHYERCRALATGDAVDCDCHLSEHEQIAALQSRLAECERIGEQHRLYGLEMDSAWQSKQEQNDELRAEVPRLEAELAALREVVEKACDRLASMSVGLNTTQVRGLEQELRDALER